MADEPIPAAAEARVDAATAAAVAVEASAAETQAAVENSTIAAAEERIEEIEETAEDIALAAVHSELGRRVEAQAVELTACRNDLAGLSQQLQATTNRLDQMTTQIAEAITRLPPIVAVSSSQPVLEGPQTEAPIAATIVEPQAAREAEAAPVAANPARKRIRLI